jgi:drug/metabolite transporter (DMT)-like permease
MNRQTQAYLFAGGTVVLWSSAASAFKLSLRCFDPLQLVLWASHFSLLSLFIVLALGKKLHLLRQYTRADLFRCALLGLLNPCLYYIALFKAYDLLPAQEALGINYSWAVLIVILSAPLLKQKIRILEGVAILISYTGVWVIATRGDVLSLRFDNPAGLFYGLASTVVWSLYWIYNTKDNHDPVAALFLNFLFGLPFVWISVCIGSSFSIPTFYGVLGAVYVGMFEMGITFVLWLTALKRSPSTARVVNVLFFTPFFSLFFIRIVLGEPIGLSTLAGLGLIVTGNILQKDFAASSPVIKRVLILFI